MTLSTTNVVTLTLQLLQILPFSTTLTLKECRDLQTSMDIDNVGVITDSTQHHRVFFGSKYQVQIRHELRNDLPEYVSTYRESDYVTNPILGGHQTNEKKLQIRRYQIKSIDKKSKEVLFDLEYDDGSELITGFAYSNDQFCRLFDTHIEISRHSIDCSTLSSLDSTRHQPLVSYMNESQIPIMTYQLDHDSQSSTLIACFSNSMCGIHYKVDHQDLREESILYNPNQPHYSIFHWFGCPRIGDLCGEPRIDSAYTKLNGDLIVARGRWSYTFVNFTSTADRKTWTLPDPTPSQGGDLDVVYDSIHQCPRMGIVRFRSDLWTLIAPDGRFFSGSIRDENNKKSRTDASYCTNDGLDSSYDQEVVFGQDSVTVIRMTIINEKVSRQVNLNSSGLIRDIFPEVSITNLDAATINDQTGTIYLFKKDVIFQITSNKTLKLSLIRNFLTCPNTTSSEPTTTINQIDVTQPPVRQTSAIVIASIVLGSLLLVLILAIIAIVLWRKYGHHGNSSSGGFKWPTNPSVGLDNLPPTLKTDKSNELSSQNTPHQTFEFQPIKNNV